MVFRLHNQLFHFRPFMAHLMRGVTENGQSHGPKKSKLFAVAALRSWLPSRMMLKAC
jgi:hypothetical protein